MARKPRNLSAEERDLWSKVTHTTVPLAGKRSRLSETLMTPMAKPAPRADAQPSVHPLQPFDLGAGMTRPASTRIDLAPRAAERVAAEPVSMDRKAYKRLSRGKLTPEARIDLHGMTLAQARPALTGFILSSHGAGRRLVLVITGKGRGSRDQPGPIPVRRGILREEVPRWLRTAPLAGAVLQIVQAHVSHGGEGAWYVYLRRPR